VGVTILQDNNQRGRYGYAQNLLYADQTRPLQGLPFAALKKARSGVQTQAAYYMSGGQQPGKST
jgi:hypothetical protein